MIYQFSYRNPLKMPPLRPPQLRLKLLQPKPPPTLVVMPVQTLVVMPVASE